MGFNTVMANRLLTEAGISPITMIQLLPVAACICDVSNRVIYGNDAAVLLLGITPPASGIIFPKNTADEQVPVSYTWQEAVPRPGLSAILVSGNATPLRDHQGTAIGWLHYLQDIPGIKLPGSEVRTGHTTHLNEKLLQSEERYYKMIEEVEDYAILLLDSAGVIQNWNKGAEKIKGYQESEIIGSHFSVFYLPEDRNRKLPEKLIAEAIRTGKAVQEGWRMRKNGTRFWGSIVITALHDAERNVIGFSKVTRDLTEKKLSEDRIRQYASELEFQNRELEQFAYAAAHDMKEPLRKIQFYSNYISDHAAEALPAKEREYLNRSINAASRMQGLIDDLLTYSRASSQLKEMEDTDLNAMVNEVLLTHSETIDKLEAIIEVGPLPVMRIIPFQFIQLFDNLISNALKYHHPERTPRIIINAEQMYIPAGEEVNEVLEGACYKISVSDNGLGFEPRHAEKIFDVFQRLHNRPEITGTGIGLAICKKIVLNHRGQIRAHGVPEEGAIFEIYIPCQQG